MPEYLKRRKYAPTESEIEAIQVRLGGFRIQYRHRTDLILNLAVSKRRRAEALPKPQQ